MAPVDFECGYILCSVYIYNTLIYIVCKGSVMCCSWSTTMGKYQSQYILVKPFLSLIELFLWMGDLDHLKNHCQKY